jgi:hypothetical protein
VSNLPTDAKERKALPVTTGVLDYFPDALVAVAEVSKAGNDQHNPGQPLHWDKTKSTDHADCIVRHLIDRGTLDSDGMRHSAKVAWRALALLQTELEAERLRPTQQIERNDSVPAPERKLPVGSDTHSARRMVSKSDLARARMGGKLFTHQRRPACEEKGCAEFTEQDMGGGGSWTMTTEVVQEHPLTNPLTSG